MRLKKRNKDSEGVQNNCNSDTAVRNTSSRRSDMYTYTLQYHQSIKEETENPYKHTVRERVSKNKQKMRLEKEKRQRRSAKQLKQRYCNQQLQYVVVVPM